MRIIVNASVPRSLINFRGPLIRAMCDSGIEVHAIAPLLDTDDSTSSQLEAWGVTVHTITMNRTGTNPLSDLRTLVSYYQLFRFVQPDAVLGYTIKPVIYGTLAARLARVPSRYALITGLGYAFTGEANGKRGLVQGFVRGLYRLALKGAKLAFFQNPDDEKIFRELKLIDSSVPSKVINGSGVDIASFSVVPLPQRETCFLLIARLLGDKGVREYVAAAQIVRERYPNVTFKLVGALDSNPNSISQTELNKWVDDGHIEYLGRLNDVRPAIRAANVYVLPSYREGTPRTVLEAMAMGRAIITTDAPGCRETVIEGENGFLVPVKSVDALVSAIECFILQPDLAVRMGLRSRQIAEEKYDVHKVNSEMLKAMHLKVCEPN